MLSLDDIGRDPRGFQLQAMRALSERSLLGFTRAFWSVLEPGRRLVLGKPLEAMAEHLEAVSDGQIRRLVINVPPGFMKSMLVDVFWPAWEWGARGYPWMRYVSFSYSDAITIRDNVKSKRLIESPDYQALWPIRLTEDVHGKIRYDNTKTGFRLASSIRTGTGERGDRVIIDDPNKVNEAESDAELNRVQEFVTEVLPTRINDPEESAIVLVQQRTSERDATGTILAGELGWDHLCLPMEYEKAHPYPSSTRLGFKDWRTEDGELLWEARYTRKYLEGELKPTMRARGGDFAVAGQLQQRPAPRSGGNFPREWPIVEAVPRGRVQARARGWDLAGTKKNGSAFTAGVRMCAVDGIVYVEHVYRERIESANLEAAMKQVVGADPMDCVVDFPQDPGQSGKHQATTLARCFHGRVVRWSPETGSKPDRAIPFSAQVKAGNVRLVRGPWNAAYVREAAVLPRGATLDQIDASSRTYARLAQMLNAPTVSTQKPEHVT